MSEGRKDDAGKLAWWLLPLEPVREIVRVLQWAAFHKKPKPYGPDNWKRVSDARQRYYDAAMRHLTEWWERCNRAENHIRDKESGFHTLAHVGCCVLFLLWFEQQSDILAGRPPEKTEFCPKCDHNWKAHTNVGECPAYAFCQKCKQPMSRHYSAPRAIGEPECPPQRTPE